MFLEDEKEINNRNLEINDINQEIKKRKFNFISNENEENDIKLINFDDIRRKNFKDEKYI